MHYSRLHKTGKCHKCKAKLSKFWEETHGKTCPACWNMLIDKTKVKHEINNELYTSYCLHCGDPKAVFNKKYGCLKCGVNSFCKECKKPFRSIQGARNCYKCKEEVNRNSTKRIYKSGYPQRKGKSKRI